jgi:hypothetical protein
MFQFSVHFALPSLRFSRVSIGKQGWWVEKTMKTDLSLVKLQIDLNPPNNRFEITQHLKSSSPQPPPIPVFISSPAKLSRKEKNRKEANLIVLINTN